MKCIALSYFIKTKEQALKHYSILDQLLSLNTYQYFNFNVFRANAALRILSFHHFFFAFLCWIQGHSCHMDAGYFDGFPLWKSFFISSYNRYAIVHEKLQKQGLFTKHLFNSKQKILFYREKVKALFVSDFVFVDSSYCMTDLMRSHKFIVISLWFFFAIYLLSLIWLASIYLFVCLCIN